jgi:hypothetical protein
MPEKNDHTESPESQEPTPEPNLLDVVKIDRRWAQVGPVINYIAFLDEGGFGRANPREINWDDYNCEKFDKYKCNNSTNVWVSDLVSEDQISPDEYMAIHWGSEELTNPRIRDFVTVFAKYTLKN